MSLDNKILNCLIVGCGNIAGGFDTLASSKQLPLTHAGAYKQHGGFRLSSCVEPLAERRLAFMSRWGVTNGYESISELKQDIGKYDVISICSSTDSHVSDVMGAIAIKPRLIFCEKPLAPSLREAEQLVRACCEAGITLVVNYSRRWDPDIVQFATQLVDGHWGKVRAVNGVYNKGLLNNGSHMIDLLHLLLGDVSVVSVGPYRYDGLPEDPSIPVQLQTQNGVTIHLSSTDSQDFSLFELHIMTDKSVVSMEDSGMTWRIRNAVESQIYSGYKCLGSEVVRAGRLPQAALMAISEIYDFVVRGAKLSCSGENALHAQRVCEAIRIRALAPQSLTF